MGQPGCLFKRRCIVLGEMVPYSHKEQEILPFFKIRKHISRSGSFLNNLQESLPHKWERLMLVYFDVLMLDDEPFMHRSLKERRDLLRQLIVAIPGRSLRSQWTKLDFSSNHGVVDLTQAFARTIVHCQEGLVLKPLHLPYLPIFTEKLQRKPFYFIKVKRDYLADMGGERGLGDFAIIGACYDSQVAPKSNLTPLHWTHYYLGCVTNPLEVHRRDTKPNFKVVGCLSLDKCIPAPELKYMNTYGPFQSTPLDENGCIDIVNIDHGYGYDNRMTAAFKKPFVAEILGGGYEKVPNETFEMLRHPRIKKIHHDRTWEDAVTIEDLRVMAEEKWHVPDADQLDGYARDVAVYAKKYLKEMEYSQASIKNTQKTTRRTTQDTKQLGSKDGSRSTEDSLIIHKSAQHSTQDSAAIEEAAQSTSPHPFPTPHYSTDEFETTETQQTSHATISSTQSSKNTQGVGLRASRESHILVHEDSSEQRPSATSTTTVTEAAANPPLPTAPDSSLESTIRATTTNNKRKARNHVISPPPIERARLRRDALEMRDENMRLGVLNYDLHEKNITIRAEEGCVVKIDERVGGETRGS